MVGDKDKLRLRVDCIPCFLRQTSEATRMSSDDDLVREAILREVMDYLLNEDWAKTPPELGTNIHRIIKKRIMIRTERLGGAQ